MIIRKQIATNGIECVCFSALHVAISKDWYGAVYNGSECQYDEGRILPCKDNSQCTNKSCCANVYVNTRYTNILNNQTVAILIYHLNNMAVCKLRVSVDKFIERVEKLLSLKPFTIKNSIIIVSRFICKALIMNFNHKILLITL